MENEKNIYAVVLEKDREVARSLAKILKRRSYDVETTFEKEKTLNLFKERPYQLALVGDSEDGHSAFESMKEIVMASPMTSIILITDLPKEEVREKAEGYGILGHVNRNMKSKDLRSLLNCFEQIFSSLGQTKD
jgi:DNA-binding response OmpR family regulator